MTDLLAISMLLVPLVAALVNGLSLFLGDRLHYRVVQRLTVGAALYAFAAALALLVIVVKAPAPRQVLLYDWLSVAGVPVQVALQVDLLSAIMALMVAGFGFVIGRFSINYMHREVGFTRYFMAYALFVFAMLLLVMADNFVLLFVGWEAVGVCSYLLISHYAERPAAGRAGTEAFIANRIGDAGFILGILLLITMFGTVNYAEVMARLGEVPQWAINATAGCLLLGALGKSAQLPLGSWLAKAMEGPTPSSALIHAATMVTAGVYLLVRAQDLYNAAPAVLLLVAVLGAATALFGAMVGQTTADIKGYLASSTTTQLGFMFLACGLGFYAVALFHLLAHAFFKSYLFLTAPSILHHLHDKLDPAAREKVPARASGYTLVTLVAGLMVALSLLSGLLPGTGAVLRWSSASWLLVGGMVIALFSAAHYGVALAREKFHPGGGDGHESGGEHDSAAPASLVVWPLMLVALAGAGGVLLQLLPGGMQGSWFQNLVAPVISNASEAPGGTAPGLQLVLLLLLVALVTYAWFTAVFLGRFRAESAVSLPQLRGLYALSQNRFYLDMLTRRYIVGATQGAGRALDRFDGATVERLARVPRDVAEVGARLTTWADSRIRAVIERSPGALLGQLGDVSQQAEKSLIGGAESAVRALAASAGRLGAALEKVLARPVVAVALVVLIAVVVFAGVR